MQRLLTILTILLTCSLSFFAQDIKLSQSEGATPVATNSGEITPVVIKVEHELAEPSLSTDIYNNVEIQDSLHLPLLNDLGQVPSYGYLGMYPLHWAGFSSWQLHKGLNVSLGASVFAEFGKNARHGAGFGQNIALQYATPLTDKLSLSVGGYFNNVYWQRDAYRDAGFSAVLGYKFNDKWEAYVYGQKSIIQSNNIMPRPLYYWDEVGDKIGAAVKYNFSPSFSVQLSVEEHIYPQPNMPVWNRNFNNSQVPNCDQHFR